MRQVDLNCDLGEGGAHDAELMTIVTSANIACGAHAGDTATMRATIELARRHDVAIGAHPGFADREHFGRRELPVSPAQAGKLVSGQIQALQGVAQPIGAKIRHVKLHGALYNQVSRDRALAEAVVAAVRRADRSLLLYVLAGSELERVARMQADFTVVSEVFADRTYQADGSLTPRCRADALVSREAAAVAQVLAMVREGRVRAVDGRDVAIRADTICLHGDGPKALELARSVAAALKAAGIAIRRPGG